MATQVITTPIWKTITGKTTTTSDAKYDVICRAVDAVIKKYVRSNIFTKTQTVYLDAPPSTDLVLRQKPVLLSGLVILRHNRANGDPSAFDAATDTLELYRDYNLDVDEDDTSLSTSGIVKCLTGIWGITKFRPIDMLSHEIHPDYKALKVTYTSGYPSVPADLQMAAAQAVTLFANQMDRGYLISSESWNGYNYSGLTTMLQNGILQHPDIWSVIQKYTPYGGITLS